MAFAVTLFQQADYSLLENEILNMMWIWSCVVQGPCHGFQEVLRLYNEITPKVRLGGPTNFAPLIRQAIDIVKKNKSVSI